VGCDKTGTSVAATVTPAPAYPEQFTDATPDPFDFDEALSVGQSVISRLSSIGDFNPPAATKPPGTPTTTSQLPWPTWPTIDEGDSLCFSSYNPNGEYVEFTRDDAFVAVQKFCDANYVMDPAIPFGAANFNKVNGHTIYALVDWAENQSGCGAKVNLPLSGRGCRTTFSGPFFCKPQPPVRFWKYLGMFCIIC
jgi:hypothetical protein